MKRDEDANFGAEWMDRLLRDKCNIAQLSAQQLQLSLDIDSKKDVFCVGPVGDEKTVVLHAGAIVAHARGEKGIALLVVSTEFVAQQQADLATRRGLKAVAFTRETIMEARRWGRDMYKELARGDGVRVAVMTPFTVEKDETQAADAFLDSVRWVSVDEAQLLEEDTIFQSGYEALAAMRLSRLRSATWAAACAPKTTAEARSIAGKLGFTQYTTARYSVDRPNVTYILRFFHGKKVGDLDLSFIVPLGMRAATEIVPTLILADTIERGHPIMDGLDRLIPAHVPRRKELVKTTSAMFSNDYRAKLAADFCAGDVRVVIACDTAQYGLEQLPNVRRVVLVDLPPWFSDLEQKLGYAGMDGQPAEAIVFAPSWVRDAPTDNADDAERRAKVPDTLLRWFNAPGTCCPRNVSMTHNEEKFVLRPQCCVPIHTEDNSDAAMVARWEKYFLARKAAAAPPAIRIPWDGTYRPLGRPMRERLFRFLERWKYRTWAEMRRNHEEPAEYFLPRSCISALVRKSHLCTSVANIRLIAPQWDYADSHGEKLLEYMTEILDEFDEERLISPENEPDSEPEPEPEPQPGSTAYGMRLLKKYATDAVLQYYCRLRGLDAVGDKDELLDSLSMDFFATDHPFPTAEEIDQVKHDLESSTEPVVAGS